MLKRTTTSKHSFIHQKLVLMQYVFLSGRCLYRVQFVYSENDIICDKYIGQLFSYHLPLSLAKGI